MTPLRLYRDDGPLATWLGRRLVTAPLPYVVLVTLLAAAPLAVVLAVSDDAPPAPLLLAGAAWFVILGAIAVRPRPRDRLAWAVPPLLRLLEYAVLIRLTAITDHAALPGCFAVLGVVAFHHYDLVYRLRHQGVPPARWAGAAGGGWDGRVLGACALAAAGGQALRVGLLVAAPALAAVFLTESVASWRRHARTLEGA